MRILHGVEEEIALSHLCYTATVAQSSKCLRSKGGSIIVAGGEIIGAGYNSPPGDKTTDHCFKDDLPADFKSDRTCCVHAEQRAITDALINHPDKIAGSRLYYIRLDKNGGVAKSGKPYCTICSKLALDVGIAEFVLWHKEGICVYNTEEYNRISFRLEH